MYFTYVLKSLQDGTFYTGTTNDLKKRLTEHNKGNNFSTKCLRSYKIIYFEGCINKQDTLRREKYLKTSWGKRYIKNRIKSYLRNKSL